MLTKQDRLRVIRDELKTTGKTIADVQSIESTKVTNDHAFYKLIYEKMIHGDFSSEQFNLLYREISEKMTKKPFTVQEINTFCKTNGIPVFTKDELLTLIPKEETKCYVDYEKQSVKSHDHGYMDSKVNVAASYLEANLVRDNIDQSYIVDSDAYYKFIYGKMVEGNIRGWALENLDGSDASEKRMREYLKDNDQIPDKELKEWIRDNPEGNLRNWLSKPANQGYTLAEYNALYEQVSEKLVHTSMNIDQIKKVYEKYGIIPPTESEFDGLKSKQQETRSTDHWESKTGLAFQGRINLRVTEDDRDDEEFNLNIDLFQDKSFEDFDNDPRRIENNEGILKALEDTVKTFNEVFGIKKDNNPLLVHGDVANFRLFLFPDKASYQKYLSGDRDVYIPGGGAAQSSDNNYISNMYSHAENGRHNGDFTRDGKIDHNDYNYVVKHEFVHALTFYLTAKLDLGTVLMEGLAEYVTYLTEGEKPAYFARLVDDKYKKHTLEEIIKGAIDPYETGAAVIAYIEETYPNFIDNLLYAATEDRKTINGRFYFRKMMEDIYKSEQEKIQIGEGFQKWVQVNSQVEGNIVESEHQNDVASHELEEQKTQQKSDKTEEDDDNTPRYSDAPQSFSYGAPGVIAQAASDAWSGISDWWSGSEQEEKPESQSEEDDMQPTSFLGLEVPRKPVVSVSSKAEEKIVLKDTILKISKSRDQDSEGKQKADVTISHEDIRDLYNKAEGAEKNYVLEFWHKLYAANYKVGALPEDKYYFKGDKFIIHNNDGKRIILPEDKVSVSIAEIGGKYSLAIVNDNSKVISNISNIDNLNNELLSDSSHFNLTAENNIELLDHHSEYNLYLENGLIKMFDCESNHVYHDHNLI